MSKWTVSFLLGAWLVLAAALSADTFSPFEIEIAEYDNVPLGSTVDVSINHVSGTELYGEFSLLVAFDAVDIELIGAEAGAALVSCGWDYFTFTTVACPGCDVKLVQIDAAAESGIPGPPTCLPMSGEIARLRLKMPGDVNLVGEIYPLDFYWNNCGDNTLISDGQDTVWHAKFVFDYLDIDITGSDPNFGGTIPGCIAPDGVVPIRGTNFHSGSIELALEAGLFGDINGNGQVNIADLTYLIGYIFYDGPDPRDYLSGDLNEDGDVNSTDVILLFEYIFGVAG
jgi:hypothetical protein